MKSPIFVFALSVLAAFAASAVNAQTVAGPSPTSTSTSATSTGTSTKPRAGSASDIAPGASTSTQRVQAQGSTATPSVKSIPSAGAPAKSARKSKSRRIIPPAPPILGSSRGRSKTKSAAMTSSGTLGIDKSGRSDLSGSSVGFYPSARTTAGRQQSATKTPGKRITKAAPGQ